MAGPDRRGRRRERDKDRRRRHPEGGRAGQNHLTRNSIDRRSEGLSVCLSVRPRLAGAADEGSEITTEEGASGDVPDQRKDHSRERRERGGRGRHEWKGTVITLKTSPQDLVRGQILKIE